MARTPIGKEKRLVGIDLVFEGNLAPPARMKEIRERTNSNPQFTSVLTQYTSILKESKVNMIHGMIGLALSFR
ncbi:MAG: hypothetical protein ICV84_18280 [Flavisolibacter sp.]|nr:hypothetical protein [Flavisolibacter sp.]